MKNELSLALAELLKHGDVSIWQTLSPNDNRALVYCAGRDDRRFDDVGGSGVDTEAALLDAVAALRAGDFSPF